jgi:putative membrane protein
VSKKKNNYFWLVTAIIVGGIAILLIGPLWNPFMLGMGMGMMGFGWGSMFLVPLAFLVLIALGIYYLVTEFMGTNKLASSQNQRPLEILEERYAKGEITREQYLEMKEELAY